jgi:transcriptional regulator with XRE-family HTH domain
MKLHDWLKQHGKTATWLAEQTGLHASYVYRLVERDGVAERSPSIETCAKIQEATGGDVTATDFMPPMPADGKRKRVPLETSKAA